MLLIPRWLQHKSYQKEGLRSDLKASSHCPEPVPVGCAPPFRFITSHPVAEAKRNSATRAAVAAAYAFQYTDSGCAALFGWDNAPDARQENGQKPATEELLQLLRLVLDVSPSSRAFNSAVYLRHSRAESFAQQLQLSIKNAAMTP